MGEELAVDGLPQRLLLQRGERPEPHRARTHRDHQVVDALDGLPDTGTLHGDLTAFFTASFRALEDPAAVRVLREVMAAAQQDPAADLDMPVDLAYGFLWYRLLVGHAPLDARAAEALAGRLVAAGAARRGEGE